MTFRGFSRFGTAPLLAAMAVFAGGAPALAQQVQLYVTSQAGDRLAAKPPLEFGPASQTALPAFRIDERVRYQTMVGFGASFLEAGLICINSLEPAAQEEVLQALFDPERGAGFSAMKTPIAATDFMSAGPYYTYDDTPGDVEMKHFSIARDLGPNGVITYIQRARKYGSFVLQAPMDYPPDWMLYDVRTHQDVDPKYFPALARYYLRYLQEYEKHGVFIDYLSLFNEPDIYTKISYEKIRELLKAHVGPLLRQAGIKTQIMLSEAPNREDAHRNYPLVLDDPAARRFVAAMPYHGYEFKDFNLMADLHRRYPELPLWMTEVDHSYGTDTPRSVPLPKYDYEDGDFWGNQIFADLEAYTSAWIYWNMILDEQGGPCLVSEVHADPPRNFQHPVVIINRKTKQVTYTGLYWYLAHFSKFVRPGARRVETDGKVPGVRCLTFKAPDGHLVSELLNSNKTEAEVQIESEGRALRLRLPALSINTCVWRPVQ